MTPRSARIERVSIATAGRRHRPEKDDVHADAGEPGDHRRFHHVAATGACPCRSRRDGGGHREGSARPPPADAERRLRRHRLALVMPRIPSVPKNFRVIARALARFADPMPEAGPPLVRGGSRAKAASSYRRMRSLQGARPTFGVNADTPPAGYDVAGNDNAPGASSGAFRAAGERRR